MISQWQSVAISNHQLAISGNQWQSRDEPSAESIVMSGRIPLADSMSVRFLPSEAKCHSAITANRCASSTPSSKYLRSRASSGGIVNILRGNPWQSVAIRGNQSQSVAISGNQAYLISSSLTSAGMAPPLPTIVCGPLLLETSASTACAAVACTSLFGVVSQSTRLRIASSR